jgi:hypothetical protein
MSNDALDVRLVSGALGAEVSGLDLSQDLDSNLRPKRYFITCQ